MIYRLFEIGIQVLLHLLDRLVSFGSTLNPEVFVEERPVEVATAFSSWITASGN